MDCQHTAWLDIIEGPRLVEHCRIQTLLDIGALDSWTQRPCLITFIGHQIKNQYLNKLLQREKNASQSAQVHIDIINPTDVPILLVDCDTDAQNHQQSASINEHCHRTEIRMLEWSNETHTQEELTKTIIERLLFPFTDVICVFADDFGGLPGVATWFKGWNTSKTTFPRSVRPKIIVVVDISNRSAHWDLISTQILMDILASISEGRVALDFQVVASPLWKPLQLMRTLVISAEEVQKVRHDTRTLFSAVHFASLFSSACDHFSHTITEPFDFIRSTRRYISVPDTAPEHLCRFLHLVTSQFDFPYVAIPLIVSSLVLNCAPPGMHVFEYSATFKTLYWDHCVAAIRAYLAQNPQSTISISEAISQMHKQFVKSLSLLEDNVTSAELHLATLRKHHQVLRKLRSDITCLSCLFRRSERCFNCGHTLCEKCIQVLGEQSNEPHKYIFKQCLLCGLPCNLNFALKPPTAGVRVLSIDGGGIRGVIPIQTLSDLQNCMEDMIFFHCPIQVNFDYAIGTSSGGLVVFGMFLKGWTPVESLKQFVALAKMSFWPRAWVARIPGLLNIHDLLVSYFADSRYSSSGIERALQEAFGQRRIMEHQGHHLNTKVAVTATTITDSSPCIFANYNGEQALGKECGYSLIQAENARDILIWEAGRCTSAAPWYFKAKWLKGLGIFQDGGLGRTNNPVEIGTFESARIWPHSLLDIVVSLGTGSSCPGSPRLLGPRGILHDGFVPRLYRSFMTSLNGQKIWDDLWNRLPVEAKDRYFRLNVRFDGKEPDIDNIGEMESLIDPGTRLPTDSETCLKIVQSLISKQFYFELDGWPLYRSGQFLCSGHIYCRFNGDLQLALLIYLRRMHARFLIGDKPITELLSHVPPNAIPGGKFGSGVEFVIRSFNECISLSLHLSGNAREISGFPTTIDSLMRAQNLNCIFGSDNHKRLAIHSESTRKRQRTSR